jgi:hypothetical protein
LRKRRWYFSREQAFLLFLNLIPHFSTQTTELYLDTEFNFGSGWLSKIPDFPNAVFLGLRFNGYPFDVGVIPSKFPHVKRLHLLNSPNPGQRSGSCPESASFIYSGTLGSYVLEELVLDFCHSYTAEFLMPYASSSSLTRLHLLNCNTGVGWEGWTVDRLHRFKRLEYLRIDPVYPGLETLFGTDAFSLKTLEVSVSTYHFDRILLPGPSLRHLHHLDFKYISVPNRIRNSHNPLTWASVIFQISQLSSLVRLILQLPFHSEWVPLFKQLSHLKRLEWNVSFCWDEFHDPESNDTAIGFGQICPAGVARFHRKFQDVWCDWAPIIILREGEDIKFEGECWAPLKAVSWP